LEPKTVQLATDTKDRHAAEWGLASLISASVLVVSAPIMLLFNVLYWTQGRQMQTPREMEWVHVGVFVGLGVVGLLCLASLLFSIMGLASAFSRKQPAGFAVAGLVFSVAAMLFWLVVGLDLLAIIGYFAGW
jgi:hypothetical protein